MSLKNKFFKLLVLRIKMKKDKLKLKPTLKEKRHYIVVELNSSERINANDAKTLVDSAILEFIGKLGYASAGPLYFGFQEKSENKPFKKEKKNPDVCDSKSESFKKSSFLENHYGYRYILLVSVLTKYVDYVKTSLTLFSDKCVKMKCVGVSGTLLKAKRFY